MFLGSTFAKPAMISSVPTLPLKIHDIGLHKHAQRNEHRHGLGAEGAVGVFLDVKSKATQVIAESSRCPRTLVFSLKSLTRPS